MSALTTELKDPSLAANNLAKNNECTLDRCMETEITYGSTTDTCPKAGFIRLEKLGHRITLPTTCKSWSCISCRTKLLNYVKMRMETGILTHPPGSLITVTYVMATGTLRDAECASKDWKQLTRVLKLRSPKMKWFKIPELTKKGQIHYHALMLELRPAKPCCQPLDWGRCNHPQTRDWYLNTKCKEDCLEHELARLWFEITKDSWVVDARPILGAYGASAYLAKYLVKAFDHRRELYRRGFIRRWSCSRNWPSPARMQLAVTASGGWDNVNFVGAKSSMRHQLKKEVKASLDDGWAIKIGTPLAEQFEARRAKRKLQRLGTLIYD